MRIKMLTRIEGTRNAVRWPEAGTVVDLPEGEARDLISSGLAEAVAEEPPAKREPEKRPARKPETRKG